MCVCTKRFVERAFNSTQLNLYVVCMYGCMYVQYSWNFMNLELTFGFNQIILDTDELEIVTYRIWYFWTPKTYPKRASTSQLSGMRVHCSCFMRIISKYIRIKHFPSEKCGTDDENDEKSERLQRFGSMRTGKYLLWIHNLSADVRVKFSDAISESYMDGNLPSFLDSPPTMPVVCMRLSWK